MHAWIPFPSNDLPKRLNQEIGSSDHILSPVAKSMILDCSKHGSDPKNPIVAWLDSVEWMAFYPCVNAYCWHLCLWLGQCFPPLGSNTTEMLGFASCLNDYDI